MRAELLSIIEKNSRIGLNELAVLLGVEESTVLAELESLEKEGVMSLYNELKEKDIVLSNRHKVECKALLLPGSAVSLNIFLAVLTGK